MTIVVARAILGAFLVSSPRLFFVLLCPLRCVSLCSCGVLLVAGFRPSAPPAFFFAPGLSLASPWLLAFGAPWYWGRFFANPPLLVCFLFFSLWCDVFQCPAAVMCFLACRGLWGCCAWCGAVLLCCVVLCALSVLVGRTVTFFVSRPFLSPSVRALPCGVCVPVCFVGPRRVLFGC